MISGFGGQKKRCGRGRCTIKIYIPSSFGHHHHHHPLKAMKSPTHYLYRWVLHPRVRSEMVCMGDVADRWYNASSEVSSHAERLSGKKLLLLRSKWFTLLI